MTATSGRQRAGSARRRAVRILVLAAALAALPPATAGAAPAHLSEGFTTVVPAGWTALNLSQAAGPTTVFQGIDSVFGAHEGPATSYAAMSSWAVDTVGTISVWLITPRLGTLTAGDAWSFYTRTHTGGFADRLELRLSANGSCDPGGSPLGVGDFRTLLQSVNPQLDPAGYPTAWTRFEGSLSAPAGSEGCLAFRYFVTDGGPAGPNSDYIGVDTFAYTDDATPPVARIDTGPASGSATADPAPRFGFSSDQAGPTFECRVDGAAFVACSGPGLTHKAPVLADGEHGFEVRATLAGNVGPPATRPFRVDTAAPVTTIHSGPADGATTPETTATFHFSAGERDVRFECAFDGPGWAACASPRVHAGLGPGGHSFHVRAIDAAGNVGPPASRAFAVTRASARSAGDTRPPQTVITRRPKPRLRMRAATARARLAFRSTEKGSTFQCRLDRRAWRRCASPRTFRVRPGRHTVRVRAIDAAGNVDRTPATVTFTVVRARAR